MYFIGIDGFPTMLEAIKSDLTQATQAQQPYLMGQIAVKNAISILKGDGSSVPKLQYQDTVLVTKENVGDNPAAKFYGPNFK